MTGLSDDLKYDLDQSLEHISDEATLYEAIEYLEDAFSQKLVTVGRTAPDKQRICKMWTFKRKNPQDPKDAIENFTLKTAPDVSFKDEFMSNDERDLFPKNGSGELLKEWMMVRISGNTTTWCYYTPDGKKKCFTR